MADEDRYLTGSGEFDPERGSGSYNTNTAIGPFSGGAILSGQEDATPIVGGRFTTQLPEGLSATLSRTGQAGAPMEYARDAIRLAKQLEAGQLALEAARVGERGLPSYDLQYSGQIGKQGGAKPYYPPATGNWYVDAGGTPGTPERHIMFGAKGRFADGGEVDAALHTVRQHFDEGGFLDSLRSLFSGDDYQSTGDKVIKDGEVQWGNPESAADFFRADKARMALDKRPAVGRPEDDVTGSMPAPPRRPAPEATEVKIPFEAPKAGVELPEQAKPDGGAAFPYNGFRAVPPGFSMPSPVAPDLPAPRAAPDVRPMAYAPAQEPPNAPAVAAINSAVAAPQIFPVNGTFVGGPASHYGAARGTLGDYARLHAGTDWQAENGTPVYSTTPGKVVYAGNHSGYGNMVDIAAPDGTIRRYAVHSGDVSVAPGTEIRAGQPIGTIGGQHLHHEVIRAGTPAAEAALKGQFGGTQRIGGTEHTIDPATVYGLKPGTAVIGPNGLPSPPKVTNRAVNYPEITDQEKDLIAKTIAAEASGKSPEEAHAIANVILNRAIAGGRYGKSIRDILLAEKQFEPWADENADNYPMKFKPGMKAYDAGAAALQKAYDAGDITGGSTYFWAPRAQGALGRDVPGFARKYPGFNIGATRFHRETREEGGEVEGYGEGGQIVKHALDAIRGWHGSGKQFKQFDASKMGSGAGELFGRGVYITDTPNFARTYRNMALKGSPEPKIGGVPVSDLYMQFERQAKELPPQDAKRIYDKMQVLEDMVGDPSDSLALREILKSSNYQPEAREWFESKVVPKLKTPGGLYEVEIKAKPEQFLQWQKPFGEQSPFIQDALRPKAVEMAEKANQARAQMLERGVDYARRPFTPERIEELRKISTPEDIGGLNLYGGIHRDYGSVNPNEWQPEANQFLRDQGVVGNTYRDMAGKGKVQNYVVYDPADTEILNRYAHGGEVDDALRVVREHHADGEAVGQAPFFTFEPTPDSVDRQAARQPAYNPADYRWSDAGSTEGERFTRALGVEDRAPLGETFMSAAPTGWDKYKPQRVPGTFLKRWGEALDENSKSISEGWKDAKEGNYAAGALGIAGGFLGAGMSPLTAMERVLVRDPYLRITGNLKDAQAAEMVADAVLTGGVRGMAKQFHKAGNLERIATEPWSKTRMPMSAVIGAGVTANTLTPDEAQASTPVAMVKPEGEDMREHFEKGGVSSAVKLARSVLLGEGKTAKANTPFRSPKQPVDATLGKPSADVMFKGKDPANWSPQDWHDFGKQYGVPNLGPADEYMWRKELEPYTTISGRQVTLPPGGYQSKDPLTYYDLLHLKSQGINPNDLPPEVHQGIHDRMVRTMQPGEGGPSNEQITNQMIFGLISPNQPLTPNELALQRAMVKGPKDLEAWGKMIPYHYSEGAPPIADRQAMSREITPQLGLQAANKGGIGASGSANYTDIAEFAQKMADQPNFYRFNKFNNTLGGMSEAEKWATHVGRVMNATRGLKAKTGSLATVWQSPENAAISAIDRHMATKFRGDMFPSPEAKAAWEAKTVDKFNAARPDTPVASIEEMLQAPGGRGHFVDNALAYVNNLPAAKTRIAKTGEYNPSIPEGLRNVDFPGGEPEKMQVVSGPYTRALEANAQEARNAGQGLFSNQWMLWDRIRNRLEPHEILFPGLEKLPRMSLDQMKRVTKDLSDAGYMAAEGAARPLPSASRAGYFAIPPAVAGGAAAMAVPDDAAAAEAPVAEAPMTEERKRGGSIVDRALMLVSR